MTKLERVTNKIFGSTATSTGNDPQIGQFGSAKAGTYVGTTDVATIQGLSAWSNGWIDAVTPDTQFPTLPEMTGVHKVLSYQTGYILQEGIAEWDSATEYSIGSWVKEADNYGVLNIYESIVDNNIGNNVSDNTKWKKRPFDSSTGDIRYFSISSCSTLNGYANILNPGSGSQIEVTGLAQGLLVTQNTSTVTRSFGETKTLTAMSIPYSLKTYGLINQWVNSTSTCTVAVINSDDTETTVMTKTKSATGTGYAYLNGTEVISFDTPVQAKGIKITVYAGPCHNLGSGTTAYFGSADVSDITYTERIGSTSGTLYFNIGGSYADVIAANSSKFSLSYVEALDVSSLANGLHYVFIHPNGTASTSTTYYGQPNEPQTPQANDIWLDTNKLPLKCYKYVNSAWQDFNGVCCGSITMNNGLINALIQPFLGVPRLTKANGVAPRSLIYSYVNGTNRYDMYNDGYCEQWGKVNTTQDVSLLKTYNNTNYAVLLGTGKTAQNANDTINVVNTSTIHIYCCNATATAFTYWQTSGYLAQNQY